MAKIHVRNAEGSPVASYDNLTEAQTYVNASWPGSSVSQPKGNGAQSLKITDEEGETIGFIDLPALDKSK